MGPWGGPGENTEQGKLGLGDLARRVFPEHPRKPVLKAGSLRPQPGKILLRKKTRLFWAKQLADVCRLVTSMFALGSVAPTLGASLTFARIL